ncbi:hypothetical protein ACOCEA_10480 [Maribacter sp. CXY002]|uniref:hypothetical protein n=1 Tax=Maribacter luteocoastalis TaxID=3407671 RepID=UPI003B6797DB
MRINRIIKTEGLLSIIGAVGLLVWWFLMPIFLPIADSSDNFKNLILNDNWMQINIIGLISILLLTLGFPGFYLKNHEKFNKLGFYGLIIASIGLILFTSIQYYETLLWPAAAKIHPELLQVNGALVDGDIGVVAGLISSGAFLGIGYILFGIAALQTNSYPKIPLWFLIIGVPLFGNGVVFPIRTIGLLLFCIGTIWLSRSIQKNGQNTEQNNW